MQYYQLKESSNYFSYIQIQFTKVINLKYASKLFNDQDMNNASRNLKDKG